MTKGKTLEELNVKVGDVVECVDGHVFCETGSKYTVSDDMEINGRKIKDINASKFRIISRANKWQICPPDYEEQTHHECAYHMGVPVIYREIEVPLVDVERRVGFTGYDWDNWNRPNATLRGQTRNGKPVGQWIIDMDESK